MTKNIGNLFLRLFASCVLIFGQHAIAQTNDFAEQYKLVVGASKPTSNSLTWIGKQNLMWCDAAASTCKQIKMSDKIGYANFVAPGNFLRGVKSSWLAVANERLTPEQRKAAGGKAAGGEKAYLCALSGETRVTCSAINAQIPPKNQLKLFASTANYSDSEYVEVPAVANGGRDQSSLAQNFFNSLRDTTIDFQQLVDTNSDIRTAASTMSTCDAGYQSCTDACDRAYDEFASYCSSLPNPVDRAGCHSYNSDLYADCLTDCRSQYPGH
jgi:hypothetical protein